MTTIAYKDGVIAGDRRASLDYLYTSGPTKIARKVFAWNEGQLIVLCGGAGNGPNMEIWKDWVLDGSHMKDRPSSLSHEQEYVAGLEIRLYPGKNPQIIYHGQFGYREITGYVSILPTGSFWAIGSGKDLALGAMAIGASAIQAVKIASHFDPHTDQQVDWLSFLEPGSETTV